MKFLEAISEGRFCISNDGCLRRDVVNELIRLGYDVYEKPQKDEPYYIISWNR